MSLPKVPVKFKVEMLLISCSITHGSLMLSMSKCCVGMKLFLREVEQNASRMEAGQGGFGRQENMAPECEPDPGRIQPDLSRIREATPEDDPWPGLHSGSKINDLPNPRK